MSMHKWLPTLMLCTCALAQDTAYFPCTEQQRGPRSIDGPVLASPDGAWQAHARVQADTYNPHFPHGDCFNTTSLLLKDPGDSSFQPVYVKKPEPYLQGNGLKLVAWSHQGHVLAAELFCFQYASDAGGFSLLLHDAEKKRTWELDLRAMFSRRFGKECEFTFARVLGFDERDRVLFEADDYYEIGDDTPDPATRCLGHRGVWALDITGGELIEVPAAKP